MKKLMLQLVIGVVVWAVALDVPVVPAADSAADDEDLVRQARVGDSWQEAEAFVVQPGKPVQMRVVSPEAVAAADVGSAGGVRTQGGERVYSLSVATDYRWTVPFGTVSRLEGNRLDWTAPAGPGHYRIRCEIRGRRVLETSTGEAEPRRRELPALSAATTFHFLVPFEFDPEGSGVIEGYPIGVYPSESDPNVKAIVAAHRDAYQPPKWFVGVTPETRDLRISKNFRLREFVPDAPAGQRVYFPHNANLCRALEAIREGLRKPGLPEPRVRILRGFISPYEAGRMRRQGIDLLTWNRYQYGDAALIIADRNLDDMMDDINGDGETDVRDAEVLGRVVKDVQKRLRLYGWIGVYGRRPDKALPDTPMIGFDLRGWSVETYDAGRRSPP